MYQALCEVLEYSDEKKLTFPLPPQSLGEIGIHQIIKYKITAMIECLRREEHGARRAHHGDLSQVGERRGKDDPKRENHMSGGSGMGSRYVQGYCYYHHHYYYHYYYYHQYHCCHYYH